MLRKSIEELEKLFAEQSARVEKMITFAIRSLAENDARIARQVIEIEEPLCNSAEIEIESRAVEIIALFAPKASDVRELISIIKANKDLERIGDHAVNIAGASLRLIPMLSIKPVSDIQRMARLANSMIKNSLESFLQKDLEKARGVLESDNIVDALNEEILHELITNMEKEPSIIEQSIRLIFIVRNLERVGDLAMNIAEDVVYLITGHDVKHPKQVGG